MKKQFAHEFQKPLPYVIFKHQTPLLRKLKDVEMQYQYNKIINLKLAVKKINGIVIHPHEVFSYWQLIGKPTRRKGYVDGMILDHGHFCYGIGGGLCQLSNLIFWMSIHTPLTIIERHRHGYDVFPDANRTQPFGSGATCFYPHGDLMIRNDTDQDLSLIHISSSALTLDDLARQIEEGNIQEINVIVKADVQGSAEAVKASLEKLDVQGVRVNVIRSTAGAITESDVVLASASNAIVIGFNVRPSANVRKKAEEEKVEIRLHNIIYKALEEMELAMKGMLCLLYTSVRRLSWLSTRLISRM